MALPNRPAKNTRTKAREGFGEFLRRFNGPEVNSRAQRILKARLAKRNEAGQFIGDQAGEQS